MTAPVIADRIRKARARSLCVLCPAGIRVGNQIGRLPGRGWAHVRCIIAANVVEKEVVEKPCD